jgi:hypothetical protein
LTNSTTAKVGDNEITDLECEPNTEYTANASPAGDHTCDEGFQLYGTTPPAAPGTEGTFVDVFVKTGDVNDRIPSAFYYVACPRPMIEGHDIPELVTSGTVITFVGCGLDAATLSVMVGAGPAVPLTSVCSSATVSFTAPDRLPGAPCDDITQLCGVGQVCVDANPTDTTIGTCQETLTIVDGAGNAVYPAPCDTADTGAVCDSPLSMQY